MADNYISNLSYTNKDFNSIFPELLDLAKKLSYRWDPTISNESDPGVVLLKMNAIIADKNNYVIDKNILETFPASVTQEDNARQLFDQLGYKMGWYKSGVGLLKMGWYGDVDESFLKISPFFQVTNADEDKMYVVLGSTSDYFKYLDRVNPSVYANEILLPKDGSEINLVIIQGTIQDYSISGSRLITLNMLDSDNRIYFKEKSIAQNGIFIENADISDSTLGIGNYNEWMYTENIASEELQDRIYTFGVSSGRCYIEFSENISDVIGAGIYIKYIVSDGMYGNVASGTLNRYYSNVSAVDIVSGDAVQLTTENTTITNIYPITYGEQPETIDSAYRNYKKTVGTFKTLVTLRDYINYILSSGFVSNGFVCDRTNDIQCSYSVAVDNGLGGTDKISYVETDDGDPLMQPFDLKFYLTEYVDTVEDVTDYSNTFIPALTETVNKVIADIDSTKSIQHNVIDTEYDKPYFFVNKYPISCTIYPKYTLSQSQQRQLLDTVRQAVFNKFNAKEVSFGEEIDYNLLYDTILSSDDRIKNITLSDIEYKTYAIYCDSYMSKNAGRKVFNEVCVSELDTSSEGRLVYYGNGAQTVFDCPVKPESVVKNNVLITDWSYPNNTITFNTPAAAGESIQIRYLLTYISEKFREDVVVKSILAGTTPLYDHNDDFIVGINHCLDNYSDTNYDAVSVTTGFYANTTADATEDLTYRYKLGDNEVLQFGHPKMVANSRYSTNVKILWSGANFSDYVAPCTLYIEDSSTNIYLMWMSADNSQQYICEKLSAGDCISLYGTVNLSDNIDTKYTNLLNSISAEMSSTKKKMLPTNLTDQIKKISESKYILDSSNYIEKVSPSETVLNGAANYCYWKLNTISDTGTYVLFDEGETEYTLQSDEYIVIPNKDRTEIVATYGFGTKISRYRNASSSSALPKWEVEAADDYIDLSEFNVSTLQGISYFNFGSQFTMVLTEMEYVNVPGGYTVVIDPTSSSSSVKAIQIRTHKADENSEFYEYNPGVYTSTDRKSYNKLNDSSIGSYKFSYFKDDDTAAEKIDKFSCNPMTSGRSPRGISIIPYLNLTTYKSIPQKFERTSGHGQYMSVKLRKKDGSVSTYEIEPKTTDSVTTDCIYVQSDLPISIVGGENVGLMSINADTAEYDYPNFYSYRMKTTDDVITSSVDGSSEITLPHTGTTESGTFRYTKQIFAKYKGTNIVKLTNTNICNELYMYLGEDDQVKLKDIYGKDDFSGIGSYFVVIPDEDSDIKINIVINSNQKLSALFVSFDALYNYSNRDFSTIYANKIKNDAAKEILEKIQSLDVDKKFNFLVNIDDSDIILNPLDSVCFNMKNHIYNKYTICKIGTTEGIKISSKTR